MRFIASITLIGSALLFVAGCSAESDGEPPEDHVFKGQVEAIDKAREVETILKRKQNQEP